MKIDLDGPQLKEAVASAVLQSLDDAKKGELISAALQHLLTPPKSQGYGHSPVPPLQEAFLTACGSLARERCKEILSEDSELWAKVEEVIQEGIVRALTGERREALIDLVCNAVTTCFRSSAY